MKKETIRILGMLASMYIIAVNGNFNQDADWSRAKSFHDFHARDLNGNDVSLDKYKGHVVVIFNGSTCPVSTKNFKYLQSLQEKHGDADGLRVVAFMVDGMTKSSGTSEEIQEYIKKNNVYFDVYEKIISSGDDAHPLYKWMQSQIPNDKIMLASKVVIDKNGQVVSKFPATGPNTELESTIKQYF